MSIDPITLSKTGSIEQSSYKPPTKAGSTGAAQETKTADPGTASTTTTTQTSNAPKESSTISADAFILSGNLAELVGNGSKASGLSGSSLATYNNQALKTQSTGSVINGLAGGGDTFTSSVVGSSNTFGQYKTMMSAASNSAASTDAAGKPAETAANAGSTASTQAATTSSAAPKPTSKSTLDDILKNSQMMLGTYDPSKKAAAETSTKPAETTATAANAGTTASTQAATTSSTASKPTSQNRLDSILSASQAMQGTSETATKPATDASTKPAATADAAASTQAATAADTTPKNTSQTRLDNILSISRMMSGTI